MVKKDFFYLSRLHNFDSDNKIMAVCVEEVSYAKYKIEIISFTIYGEQYHNKGVFINRVHIKEISLDEDKNLNITYSHQFADKITSLRFLAPNGKNLARYIGAFFLFIKNNAESVEKYGFREFIGHESILSHINLGRYYEKVIKLKTHRLSSSVSNVGKDNDFYEDMVITYENDKDYYFIKLLSDFFKSTYDFKKKIMVVGMGRESAWSPSFEAYTTPDNFEYKRAEFINYIANKFDYNEGCKFTLLNMPLKESNVQKSSESDWDSQS